MGEGTYSKGGLSLNSQVLQQHLTCRNRYSRSGWGAMGKTGLWVHKTKESKLSGQEINRGVPRAPVKDRQVDGQGADQGP